jgi:flavin-dependent dehydrogenase
LYRFGHLNGNRYCTGVAPGVARNSMSRETDVLVVGGGPAGLAAGIAARKKGFRVTVVDGARPPIDKACGEGLLPGTLAALRELGITIQAGDGQIFRRICFIDGVTSAEANFPGEGGIGVRRTVLHQKMVERAEECGVELLWSTPVTGILQSGAVLGANMIQAKWVIGADGIRSRVRRWSGLDAGAHREVRFAQRRHYRIPPRTDCVEVHWGRKMQAYVTPLANEETCVVLISRDPAMRFEEALREFPGLAGSLVKAKLSSVQRGTVTATCKLDRVCRGNIALTGDASGSVDAITGEGLGLSFRQALALADALETGELEKYQAAHRRLTRRPQVMARLLLLLERCTPLRRRVLRGLAGDPGLFSRMLAAHVKETSPAFLAKTSARLGWRLITA